MEKHKGTESIHGSMEIVIKDSLKNVSNMEKEYKNLLTVIYIKDTIKMANLMVKEITFGTMEAHIRVILSKDYDVVKGYGENQTMQVLIHMKVNS